MTLGDALSQNPVKDASIASLEELQNLAGGSDIKVLNEVAFLLLLFLEVYLTFLFRRPLH